MTSLPSTTQTEDYIKDILKTGAQGLNNDQLKEALSTFTDLLERNLLNHQEKYYLFQIEEELRQRGLIFSVHAFNKVYPEGELFHFASRKELRKELRSQGDTINNYYQSRPHYFEPIFPND